MDSSQDSAYVVDAGDLDGDGLSDVLDVRDHAVPQQQVGWTVYRGTTTVAAYRGRDGKPLWMRTFAEGDYVFVVPARVGGGGKRGVLFVAYEDLDGGAVGVAGDASVTMTAVDGAGTQVWSRTVPGGYVAAGAFVAPVWVGAEAYPVVVGAANMTGGAATDLLVDVVADVGGSVAPVEAHRVLLVDGADGELVDTGVTPTVRGGYASVSPAPDLDRNGLADFAVMTGERSAPKTTTVAAYRAGGGSPLWTRAVPSGWATRLVAVGDATGDGTVDVAVGDGSVGFGEDVGSSHLIDGRTGALRWTKRGQAFRLGDIDGDRRAEVVLLRYATNGRASVRAEAYDMSGRLRWQMTRALPASAADDGCPIPDACTPPPPPGAVHVTSDSDEVTVRIAPVGDVHADGVVDIAYSITVEPRGKVTRREVGVVDGRTGKVSKRAVADLLWLEGPVDGRGIDAMTAKSVGGQLIASAWAGNTGRMLWRTTVSVASAAHVWITATASTLTSHRCADVMVTVDTGHTIDTVAFSGATGLPLWQVVRDGTAATGKLTHPAVRARVDHNGCR